MKRLSYLYKHVDDLDLTVAFLETHVKDALFGPTLRCIVGEQFYRSRVGDRYFFEHKDMPHSFSDGNKNFNRIKLMSQNCVTKNIKLIFFRATGGNQKGDFGQAGVHQLGLHGGNSARGFPRHL